MGRQGRGCSIQQQLGAKLIIQEGQSSKINSIAGAGYHMVGLSL
jgi:hypothetical protein